LKIQVMTDAQAQRYLLGVNYEQPPVNRYPFGTANYQRDGFMRADSNGGSGPNYWPNSFDAIAIDQRYKEPPMALESRLAAWYNRNAPGKDDHYTQPGNLFRQVMSDDDRQHLIHNIVAAMQGMSGPKRDEIVMRQLCHFFRTAVQLRLGVAQGLRVDVEQRVSQGHVLT
jgi:catalase